MLALFGENGPFSLPHGKTDPVHNQYGWNAFANIMYVDQPPGTGFSYTTNPVRMSVCVCVLMLFWLIIMKSTNILWVVLVSHGRPFSCWHFIKLMSSVGYSCQPMTSAVKVQERIGSTMRD